MMSCGNPGTESWYSCDKDVCSTKNNPTFNGSKVSELLSAQELTVFLVLEYNNRGQLPFKACRVVNSGQEDVAGKNKP